MMNLKINRSRQNNFPSINVFSVMRPVIVLIIHAPSLKRLSEKCFYYKTQYDLS